MIGYRRNFTPRDSLFVNARLHHSHSNLLVQEFDTLRRAMREAMSRYPFRINVITVLPSEIMAIWTLPQGDNDYATRWALIQSLFATNLHGQRRFTPGPAPARETRIWERCIRKRNLRTNMDYESHKRHIELAAMSEGLVNYPEDWPYCSLNPDMVDAFADIRPAPTERGRPIATFPPRHRAIRASG